MRKSTGPTWPWISSRVGPWLGWLATGAILGGLAWGIGRTPMLAVLLPLLCFVPALRSSVFFLALGYHLATARHLPAYAQNWFGEPIYGLAMWLILGVICAAAWSLIWTRSTNPWRVGVASASAFLVTLLPPVALVLPGHPLVAWGFIVEGMGWIGVLLAVSATVFACVSLRRSRWAANNPRLLALGFVVVGGWMVAVSFHQTRFVGRAVDDMVAFNTGWGSPPRSDEEITRRIEKAAAMTRAASGGEGSARLVVFPETSLGQYDPSFGPVLRNELGYQAKRAGQSIIIGAEIPLRDKTMQNLAFLIRKDGTMSYVVQRQPALISMWAPWRERHFPANWLSNNVLSIEPEFKARVMFCFEEYIPFLHLLNEAQDHHSLVIVLANAWAAPNLEATVIQATHTEGMARLFNRQYLRSENYQPAMAKARRAMEAARVIAPR